MVLSFRGDWILTERVPLSRPLQILGVDSIPWDCDLADVIEKVLDENLDADHLEKTS